eukprot:gene6903-9455_t
MTRRILIGGNWKCNGTIAEGKKIVDFLNNGGEFPSNAEVVIAVPSIHLTSIKAIIRPDVNISSEDVGVNSGFGAYTGEISAQLLVDAGITWTLTGHSERRVGFGIPGETSEIVAKKTAVAIRSGLSVIACIGEKLAERENGTTMVVCAEQLAAIAAILTPEEWSKVVIAYEPVWAIGTGKVATPEQAEATHKDIRDWLAANVSVEVAEATRILYGGSVKGNNCASLISCPNIDGFLVGGASLLPEFVDIITSAALKA